MVEFEYSGPASFILESFLKDLIFPNLVGIIAVFAVILGAAFIACKFHNEDTEIERDDSDNPPEHPDAP